MKKLGNWIILSKPFKNKTKKRHRWYIKCKCNLCGAHVDVLEASLKNGKRKGC